MRSIQFSGLVRIFILLGLLFNPAASFAQPTTAATYPFTPFIGTYTYLTGGTSVGILADDANSGTIPIGFPFYFAGTTYTTLTACSNGWLSLGNSTSTTFSVSQANMGTISPVLMPIFSDLTGSGGQASYLTTGSAPNRVFTFEYKSWRHLSYGTPEMSMQVKLYEGGVIDFVYKNEGSNPLTTGTGTIGIAASTSDFLLLNNTSTAPTTNSATFVSNLSAKPATDQVYRFGQIPCSGVPTTSISGPTQVCPNKPFSLSLSGMSLFSGLVFQWETSPSGTANWTKFTGTGGTSVTITDIISVPKWYRATVTCTNSGQSYTTQPYKVDIAPFYYCYCDGSKATAAAGADVGNMKIQSESNGAIKLNNGSALPFTTNANSNKTYSDFRYTVPAVPIYRDSSYVFTVSQINSAAFNSAIAAVYVDYNRNGRFDTVERVLLQATANTLPTPGVVRDTFRIPDTAGIGLTGMRVILRTGTDNPDTCALYTDGETEDYLLDIRYEPCTGDVNPGTVVSTDTTMCPGYRYSIADTTLERKKSDITWWWQYSPDGLVWANLPNSVKKDTFNNLLFSNTIYYRVKAVCLTTNDTTISNARKVEQKAAYKCYCYSLADGNDGNTIDSSDIGAVGLGGMMLATSGPHIGNELAVCSRTDYTDMVPVELETEHRYKLLVYHTMNRNDHADAKVTVFIDFNNDKQYNIPQERVGTWFTSINSHTIIDSIYIPDSAIVNVPTGMRVILSNNVAPNVPSDFACGTYTSGETEDFIVMFRRPIITGVQTLTGISNLGLYPNPTSGKFRIQFDGAAKDLEVSISTVTGQQVQQRSYHHNGGLFSEEIDMSSHAKGVYFVELKAGGEKMTRKLVIQ